MKSELSQEVIRTEQARRAKIWKSLQPIARRVLEEFRRTARERGVTTDDWINWFDDDFILVRVNIKSRPHGPYYTLLNLYKNGRLELDPSENYNPYDYPEFSDNAVSTFRPKLKRELQRQLDGYCAKRD